MRFFVLIILLQCNFYGIDGRKRYWIRNSNILNKDNWEKDAKNCKGLFFPAETHGSMLLDNITTSEIILPVDGELYINNNAEIILDNHDEKCITLKPQDDSVANFLDPRNWDHLPNKAIPDTNRIPCIYDDIFIPANSTMNVNSDLRILYVNSVNIIGGGSADLLFFQKHNWYGCYKREEYDCVCLVQFDYGTVEDICDFVKQYRKDADACENPFAVHDYFCTKICGAYIRFHPAERIPKKFIDFLEKHTDYIDYYITGTMQVESAKDIFIVDKYTDNGFYSVFVAEELYKLLKADEMNYKVTMVTSGKPQRTKEMLQFTFGMLFGALLLTVVFFAVIFAVYVGFPTKYTSKIKWLPKTKYTLRPFTFARFENRDEGDLSFDRSIAGSCVSLEKSFQNPLYGAIPSTSKEFTEFGSDIAEILDAGGEEMKDMDSPLVQIEDLNEEDED